MFPKLYGSNSIFDVLTTSVYLYCILYYKAAVFNDVLLYLPLCFECFISLLRRTNPSVVLVKELRN